MPKPGPGKGCLFNNCSEIPNSFPIILTSSLNKALKGSTNLSFIVSGKPPTL